MKRRWLVCSVVLLSLVLALPASTQTPTHSVLTNGGFEVNTSGWTGSTLARVTSPVHSGSGAGAVTLEEMFPGAGMYSGIASQCFNLADYPDWPMDSGTKYLTINGYLYSDGTAEVSLFITRYSGADCTVSSQSAGDSTTTTSASWELHTLTAAIPDGWPSIRIGFGGMSSAASTFYADDLAAFSSTATAVKTQGMAARTSLWAAGLVGVVAVGGVLGRRKKETGCRNK